MYVCVCMAVTERQIRQAVEAGARTLKDLRRDLGVSSECGQCAAYARQCLNQALAEHSAAAKIRSSAENASGHPAPPSHALRGKEHVGADGADN